MRAPFTQLYVHCVWATWDRLPLVTAQIEPGLRSDLRQEPRAQVRAHRHRGMPDHVHLLVRLSTTLAVADLVKEIKGASSHLVHAQPHTW